MKAKTLLGIVAMALLKQRATLAKTTIVSQRE